MERSFVIEDDKDRQILELTREVEEWKRKAVEEERQHQEWKKRCEEVQDKKNRLQTHSTLYNRLDEVDHIVHQSPLYHALRWDIKEKTPDKRVALTKRGACEKLKDFYQPSHPNQPNPKKVRLEEPPSLPKPSSNMRLMRLNTQIINLLNPYFSPSPTKRRKEEHINPSAYKTEGGFKSLDSRVKLRKLEESLRPEDTSNMIEVFRVVFSKLKENTN